MKFFPEKEIYTWTTLPKAEAQGVLSEFIAENTPLMMPYKHGGNLRNYNIEYDGYVEEAGERSGVYIKAKTNTFTKATFVVPPVLTAIWLKMEDMPGFVIILLSLFIWAVYYYSIYWYVNEGTAVLQKKLNKKLKYTERKKEFKEGSAL